MENFVKSINDLQAALHNAISKKVDLSKKDEQRKILTDYQALKTSYVKKAVETSLQAVRKYAVELYELNKNPKNSENIFKIQELVRNLQLENITQLESSLISIKNLMDKLDYPKHEHKLSFKVPYIPEEIKADVLADIKELENCFEHGCYRSAAILCGRILETALHRKYFETTGLDVLEKNPGIGLGTLIAKLREKNVQFDPGLTEQIHLINQVRIFSVHTKKDAFYPSKTQTHAMILYTLDILEKLFR